MAIAIASSTGYSSTIRSERPDEVERALDDRRRAGEAEAPHAHDGHPEHVVELDRGSHDLEHAREHAHLHAERLHALDRREHHLGVGPLRRHDHAVDLVPLDDPLDVVERTEHGAVVILGIERHAPDDRGLEFLAVLRACWRTGGLRRRRRSRGIAPRRSGAGRTASPRPGRRCS